MKPTNSPGNCFDLLPALPLGFERPNSTLGTNTWAISITAAVGDERLTPAAFRSAGCQDAQITADEMEVLLEGLGIKFKREASGLPVNGIALIQLDGPWQSPGTNTSPYPYHHWVAVRGGFTFDANIGDWIETQEWHNAGARRWMIQIPRCVGYQIKSSFSFSAL